MNRLIIDFDELENKGYLIDFDEDGATIASYDGFESFIWIPSHIMFEGKIYNVQSIGDGAFAHCENLKMIKISEGVKKIGIDAFVMCRMLTNVYLPTTLVEIGKNAFKFCSGLKFINIPEGITIIKESTFEGCKNLRKLILPTSLKKIENSAFFECSFLDELIIPVNVEEIKSSSFMYCNFKKITVDNGNKFFDSRNNCNAIIEKSNNKLVRACENTILPNDIQIIGSMAYQNVTINNIFLIPESVIKIESNAFTDCYNLNKIILLSAIIEIENKAFSHNNSLEEIYIKEGNDVEFDSIIYGCRAFKCINFYDNLDECLEKIGMKTAVKKEKCSEINTNQNIVKKERYSENNKSQSVLKKFWTKLKDFFS